MATALFCDPYPTVQNIRRLALVEATAEAEKDEEVLPAAAWDRLKTQVQSIFAELATQVEDQYPTITSRAGVTAARSYGLIFRTFYPPPGNDKEPVVVSVTLEPEGTERVMWGDIVGEDSGDIFYESTGGRRVLNRSFDAILSTAEEIARELASRNECIARALGALTEGKATT